MLLDLSQLISQYNLSIKGIIHAGAHYGEEYTKYSACGIKRVIFIEPSSSSFEILKSRFKGYKSVTLFNCAVGSKDFTAQMNVEYANKGQSNSLLEPAKHLDQYPDIQFLAKEEVRVHRIDSLIFDRKEYNLLYMDIQGYELEALKGATSALTNIDYIYTEVNREELYKKCARVEQLDKYLKDFDRVHTDWCGGTWGDALYVRKKKCERKIVNVPQEFMPRADFSYPADNKPMFEEWFYDNIDQKELSDKRYYLPIFWTPYYVKNDYGKNKESIDKLQKYINTLDTNRKYFTVYQFDDGILNDLSKLDIKVFGMSGKGMDHILPLICHPHKHIENTNDRPYLANFIGRDTHEIRNKMTVSLLKKEGYYISDVVHNLDEYCKMLASSVFTLCPRGYGQTSFRIAEALQYGSIPVYISDEFLLHDQSKIKFKDYGVLVKSDEVDRLDVILKNISRKEIEKKQAILEKVYKKYYSFESNKKMILSKVTWKK